ncbi:MAG: hypothetical protein AMJ46_03760 [Latescibacteria bacterium DG_63]|nr:MAG: hypothetical protein AMJ46_03760 [Latescibacteria bacterium DG_63]
MSKAFAVCFLLLLFTQPAGGPAVRMDDFAPGWSISGRALRFAKSNLYDYIDGGAELFLEFGFEDLTVYRYERGEEELTLEMYRLESPEAALGIYLMKCGDETPIKGVGARNSGDRYQFNVLKGNYFVQVNSFEGSDSLIPVMVALTQRALQGIPEGDSVKLFSHLPGEGLVDGSELIVRGPYALQPIFTFGKGDVLQLKGQVFGVVGDYALENSRAEESAGQAADVYTRIVIPYPDGKTALSAYENLVENLDPHLNVLDESENGFTFRDYRYKFGAVELRGATLELKVNLPERPTRSSEMK